jgi:glycosyltransferase involved in cell wall biosynthesis
LPQKKYNPMHNLSPCTRISYLTGEYPRATDTFIQREVAALRAQGFIVDTCTIRRTGLEHLVGEEQRREAAQTFHVLEATASPRRSLQAHLSALRRAPRRYARALALAWRTGSSGFKARAYQIVYFAEAVVLADYLRARGTQHLHNHMAMASCSVAMLASEISGIPYSFTMHGPDIFFEPRRWRIDEKIARAAFVACISHFCRSQGMLFSAPTHWNRLHIVHCGIDPVLYDRSPSGPGAHLLFVGRLAAVKGVPVLFRALTQVARQCSEVKLTLIGDGPERARLEAEAHSMGLGGMVHFAGYRSQIEVAEALAGADVLVLPSFAEGLPVVLMEAMAARLPVVATRIAGVPELVEHGISGLLVSPGDANALAEAIARLLGDAALRVQIGAAGRVKVLAEFDIAQEAAWLGRLLQTPMGTDPRPGLRPNEVNAT